MNKMLSYSLGVLVFFALFFLNQCASMDDPDGTDTDKAATADYLFDADDKCLGQILEKYLDENDPRNLIYFIKSDTDYVAMINADKRVYETGLDGNRATTLYLYPNDDGVEDEVNYVAVDTDISNLIKRDGDHKGIFFRIHNNGDGYIDYYSGRTWTQEAITVTTSLSYNYKDVKNNNSYKPSSRKEGISTELENAVVFSGNNIGGGQEHYDIEKITGFPSFFSDLNLQIHQENPSSYVCKGFI